MPKKFTATERSLARGEGKTRLVRGERSNDLDALREDQRMLASLLGDLPGMVYRCRNDKSWTAEFVSEGCLALTGRPASDLMSGAAMYGELVHPDDRDRVWNDTQKALAEHRPFQMVYRIRTAGGEQKWVWEQGHGVFTPQGELLCLEGFIADITERVQAEERLRESEARFRSLTNLSSHWYWEQDAEMRFTRFEGRYVERNSSVFALFVGKRPWESGIDSADGSSLPDLYYPEHKPFQDVVLRTPLLEGRRVYIQVSGEPIFGSDGRFLGYRGVGRDVTKQKLAEQATSRLGRMYAALSATNEAILRAHSPEELYQKVCDAAVHGGKFITTAAILADPATGQVTVAASTGVGAALMRQFRISVDANVPEGRGTVGTAYRTGKPCVTNDYLNDERVRPWRKEGIALGVGAAASIPLFLGGRTIGTLLFYSSEKGAFDDEIVRLLERLAENVSFALDNFARQTEQRHIEQATRRLSKMYAALSATNEAILRARSPEELYQKVCDAAVHGGKFIAASGMLVQPESEWMKLVVVSGFDAEQWRGVRISIDATRPEGQGLVGTAYRTRKPAVTNDYMNDARLRPWRSQGGPLGVNAAAAIPLFQGEQVKGVLLFYSGENGAFDADIVKLLERMAENVSFALDNFEREKERRRAEQALRESEERFKSLTEFSSDWFWEQDEELRFTMITYSQKVSNRHPAESMIGRRRWDLPYYPDMTEADWAPLKQALAARQPFRDFLIKRRGREDEVTYSAVSGVPIFDAQGNFKGYRGTGRDVTDRIRAEADMRKLSGAIEQTADCVMITDRDGTIEYVNAAFERTSGYGAAEVLGRKPSVLKSGVHGGAFYERLWSTVLAGDTFSDVFINRKKDGALYYEERTISPLRDAGGRVTHFIATGRDITERMQAQERLQHIAHHDALTGLPNRVLFLDRLNQALIRAHWQKRVVGVMFLDLDRFKNINDTLGHDTGDALLKAMAARLQGCVRAGDSVARLGGDEFAVLLEDVAQAEDISSIASKILGAFMLPFAIQGHELFITASIGISMYPTDGTTPATLLKNADAAMYRAKDLGKNNYQFYSADMSAAAFERLTLESSLRRALEREEFVLHYQPQIDLATGRVIALEALIRWQHPDFGLLAPTQFIGIAEETGAIVQVGEWVARTAMLQVRRWHEAGFGHLRVAVNVSGRQFNEPNFVDMIAQLLRETGLPPEALELEITESVIMKNAEKTVARLRALHGMGVRFAIDDFGTGYSSLSYLRRFAIHTLKVDKSFIHDITADSGDVEIVKTIIMMARGLKLSVIAEGVETREQLVFLKSHGCHGVQGYLVARPLSTHAMTERLKQGDARVWLP